MTVGKKSVHRVFAMIVAGLCLSALAHGAFAQELPKVKFSLDWLLQGPTAPYLLAQSRGYFKQEGLDVEIDAGNGSTGFILRVGGGAYDLAIGDLTAFIENLATNPGPSRMKAVFVIYNQAPNVIFTLKRTGIEKPADLAGKRIAGASFSSTRKLWPLFARATHIDPQSVTWVSVDPQLREPMLIRGQVDAVAGFTTDRPTYTTLGVAPQVVALNYADYGVRLYGNAIFASTRMIEQQPKLVAAFLRAVVRGFQAALADPAAAIDALKQRDPLTNAALERERFDDTRALVVTGETKKYGLGAAQRDRLETQIADTVYAFHLAAQPDVAQVFTPSFLPPLADRLPPGP